MLFGVWGAGARCSAGTGEGFGRGSGVGIVDGLEACNERATSAVGSRGWRPEDEVGLRKDEGSGQQPQVPVVVRPGGAGSLESRRSACAQRTHEMTCSRSETRWKVGRYGHGLQGCAFDEALQ